LRPSINRNPDGLVKEWSATAITGRYRPETGVWTKTRRQKARLRSVDGSGLFVTGRWSNRAVLTFLWQPGAVQLPDVAFGQFNNFCIFQNQIQYLKVADNFLLVTRLQIFYSDISQEFFYFRV